MTTPKRNEAVAPCAWIVSNGGQCCEPWVFFEKSEVDAMPSACIADPVYSQQTIDALQGEVSRLRAIADAARIYFHGYCQDEASDEVDGNGRGRWTGCPAYQIRDALALKEALNLEPPTDGR